MKPRLFIGASAEHLDLADAAQKNLEHDAEVTVWTQGVFKPSAYSLDALLEQLDLTDFGLFIFAGDDIVNIRGKDNLTVRDNVVFELGLFIGRLGRKRNFFVMPRDVEDFSVPTDLSGITPLNFDPNRSDKNMVAALGSACGDIRREIKRLGRVVLLSGPSNIGDAPTIISAIWGPEENWNDVTDILVAKLQRGERNIQVTRGEFGDPAPYRKKLLKVTYIYRGRTFSKVVPEDENLILPEG